MEAQSEHETFTIDSDNLWGANMRTIRLGTLTGWTLFAFFLVASTASGQEANGPLIAVDLEATRGDFEASRSPGFVAVITNTSKEKTVYLREHDLAISLPPELDEPERSAFGSYGFFPTEPHDTNGDGEKHSNPLILQPGDSYGVVWSHTRSEAKSCSDEESCSCSDAITPLKDIWNQRHFLFFAPGNYEIVFNGKYWTEPGFPDDKYRTLTTYTEVAVAAPEFIIVFGAMVGGVIAFRRLPQRGAKKAPRRASEVHDRANPEPSQGNRPGRERRTVGHHG